jgi:cytochrome c oxidase subunit II
MHAHGGSPRKPGRLPAQRAAAAAVPLALLAGCGGPLSTLEPAGPAAEAIAWLWWAMLAGAGLLTLVVLILLAMAFGRPRPVPERRWTITLGLWFSMAILTSMLAAGIWVGERLLPGQGAAVTVEAHAFQWGWRFSHPDGAGGTVETDAVLHIPAGRPVDVRVTAADVIHAFWVPRLAGKIDAIPGRTNILRLEAASPGTYDGLCAEFCGLGHAAMRFSVEAHPPEDWDAAIAALRAEAGE